MATTLSIQRSQRSDCDELRAMQHASLRELGRRCYDDAVIEAYIAHIGTMDVALIDDGTFFTARIGRVLVASGGWSWRVPGYASCMADRSEPPSRSSATIRSIFVHPAWSGRGLARQMMAHIEDDIAGGGYDVATMAASLVGIPFYRRIGYHGHRPAIVALPGDLTFIGLHMEKRLADQRSSFARAA